MRLGCVQADSYLHAVYGNERTLGGDGRRNGVGRARETDEERVPLGIDLVPIVGLEHLAEHATMLGTQVTVRGTMSTRKLRGAFDVAEQEGHRPAR